MFPRKPTSNHARFGAFPCSASLLALAAIAALAPRICRADYIFASNDPSNSIGEYTTSGALVNSSFVSGLSRPSGLAVEGSDLFVANLGTGTIGEYNVSGATVNAALITGLQGPSEIAVSGSKLFVLNSGTGTLAEYTTSGALVNSALITGLSIANNVQGLVANGSDLFLLNSSNKIEEFTTAGTPVNTALVTGLFQSTGLAIDGSDLFTTETLPPTVGEYTTSGVPVNPALVTEPVFFDLAGPIVTDGSDLFVGNSGTGTLSEFTTSGATVNPDLINFPVGPAALAIYAPPVLPVYDRMETFGMLGAILLGFAALRTSRLLIV